MSDTPVGPPDPRPRVSEENGRLLLHGWECTGCGHRLGLPHPRCPVCTGALRPAAFGPGGVVWSSTVVRIPLPGRVPPYVLAYVDFEGGPRVLAHVHGDDEAAKPGIPVVLVGVTDQGDPQVKRVMEASQ